MTMTDWKTAAEKAAKTAKWATTMTKWLITRTKSATKWQLVAFAGPSGRESAGIVDILAIRKDHRQRLEGLKRGDLFEIVVIQIKGGSAAWPSPDDVVRLRKVGNYYKAKAVLLAEWKKGQQPTLYRLKSRLPRDFHRKDVWEQVTAPSEIFN